MADPQCRVTLLVCANDDQWRAYIEVRFGVLWINPHRAEGPDWLVIRYTGEDSTRGRRFHEAVFLGGWQLFKKTILDDLDRCLAP